MWLEMNNRNVLVIMYLLIFLLFEMGGSSGSV